MFRSMMFVVAASLTTGGCLVSAKVSSLGYVELAIGSNAQRADAGLEVARSAAELESLWTRAGFHTDAPAVDFSREMVIAYFMGARATGGYATRITDVTSEGAGVRVDVRNVSPGASCAVTQATTSPAVLVRTELSAGPVALGRISTEIQSCR